VPGDAEATRQRLIEAARAEFAAHGIAGARVDRIAAAAEANKAQIYHYFGSKDRLFDAVWETLVKQVVQAAPIDPSDLAGFAARLAETYAADPDLTRVITWQRLERGGDQAPDHAVHSTRSNIDAIAEAQAEGVLPDRFRAPVLFALIVHIAALWEMSSPDVLSAARSPRNGEPQEIIRSAVAALLAQPNPSPPS
jgi:AcrR family transcriptional regulator